MWKNNNLCLRFPAHSTLVTPLPFPVTPVTVAFEYVGFSQKFILWIFIVEKNQIVVVEKPKGSRNPNLRMIFQRYLKPKYLKKILQLMQLEKIIDRQETQSFQVLPHRWFVHFLFQHCKCDTVPITARRCLDFAKDGTHFAQMGLATPHISWRKRCLLATLLVVKAAFKHSELRIHVSFFVCMLHQHERGRKKSDKITICPTVQLIAPRFFPRVLPGLFVFQHGLHNGSVILLGWFYSALTKNSCHLNTFFSLGGLQGSAKAPTQPYTQR